MKQAILAAGIPAREFNECFAHVRLNQCPCPEKFKFAFVRHPVSLYRSYWLYKMTVGWDLQNKLDQTCRSDDFNDFISQVLEKFPGIYGRSLIDYVGTPEDEIEFVGRFENLVEDLIRALQLAGESFDPEIIRAVPPNNVSNKALAPARYTPELEAAVRAAEQAVLDRFGYK